MPIPNGGLITETNRQYYAGAQQFTIGATGVGQTFISTFDTKLVFGNSDPASNGYNLNNFKVFTSPDAVNWTELTPTATATTGTSNGVQNAGSANLTINPGNNNVLVGFSFQL